VRYREAHELLEELDDATLERRRKEVMLDLATVPLLVIDDLGMRKLPTTAAEDLLELIMRRYGDVSTLLTSNRPVDDWGRLLRDTAAVSALLDRLLHHAHVLQCGPQLAHASSGNPTEASGPGVRLAYNRRMSPDEIRARVARLDTRNATDSENAWAELRPLHAAVVPYLLEQYRRAKRGEARVVLVFHAIRFARKSDAAITLGIAALKDRAATVRYRACGLLAYSLRRDTLPTATTPAG
jgi:hypothetical protein